MRELSFNSSQKGPKRSAYRRLIAGRISAGAEIAAAPRISWTDSRVGIFREIPTQLESHLDLIQQSLVLSGLEAAVVNTNESSDTMTRIWEGAGDVHSSNIGASALSVQEVDAAVKLAEEPHEQIVRDRIRAKEAHAARLGTHAIQRLLD